MGYYKKVGDSMAGYYFQCRLHPFDLRELHRIQKNLGPSKVVERILLCSRFSEPFLENCPEFYSRWRKTHLDIILRQDLIDLKIVTRTFLKLETLKRCFDYLSPITVQLLKNNVE